MGLAGDHLLQCLVGKESRHCEETGDHRNRQRRRLRVMWKLPAGRDMLALLEALI